MKMFALFSIVFVAMTSATQAMDVCGGWRAVRNMYGQVVPVRVCRPLIPNNAWGQYPNGPRAVVVPLGVGVNVARSTCIAWPCH